jgi:IS5 family transposase
MFACAATDDFFRSRIDHMIDLRHPLAVLASRMPWQEIEARVAQVFSRKGRAGVAMPDLDLFGEQVQRTAVLSNAGRPRVPLRIMIALLYLKHAFNESDEGRGRALGRDTHLAVLLGAGVLWAPPPPATPPP